MTTDEFDENLSLIHEVFNQSRQKLCQHFAERRATYKIGQRIKDVKNGDMIILIEKIGYYHKFLEYPIPTYVGRRLNKRLSPMKPAEEGMIYQTDDNCLIEVIP